MQDYVAAYRSKEALLEKRGKTAARTKQSLEKSEGEKPSPVRWHGGAGSWGSLKTQRKNTTCAH